MINYLQDVSTSYPIAMLPGIINYNNQAIMDEFNWIFDSSLNRLTKSVYAPTGSVQAHFGEFNNLACEYITIKNTDSFKKIIEDSVQSLDAKTIKYDSSATIHDKISGLDAAIKNIIDSNSVQTTQVYGAAMFNIDDEQDELIPITYPKSLLYASPVQLKRQNLPKLHYNDIQLGYLYTYYPCINDTVTIDNINMSCITCKNVGQIINVNLNIIDSNNNFEILLSRANKEYVVLKPNTLTRLQLKCEEYTESLGTKWEIYLYSVNIPDAIKKVNK